MPPSPFTFKVSVPNDPRLTAIIGELAKHAAAYAELEAGAAASFVRRAEAVAARVLESGSAKTVTAVIAVADGTLTVTMGSESASQSL